MCVDVIVAMVWWSFIVKRFWILLNITGNGNGNKVREAFTSYTLLCGNNL
jgi:hypothetical protein